MPNSDFEFTMNGGSTSVYPCFCVCRSSIKLISARSSRAPAPMYTANRAPLSLAARSRSRMPSASPISQCGFGSKSNVRFSPHVFTVTLSASEVPAGTSSRVRLGILGQRLPHLVVKAAGNSVQLVEFVFQALGFLPQAEVASWPVFFNVAYLYA